MAPTKPKPVPPEGHIWLAVEVPPSVAKIIHAAGGDNAEVGGMPYAIASIIGCLPWVAVALHQQLAREDYREFVAAVRLNLTAAWVVVNAEDPQAAFELLLEQALADEETTH